MAFTADIIQDTLQGVFLFTKFGVILLILKLFQISVELLTRVSCTTMRAIFQMEVI